MKPDFREQYHERQQETRQILSRASGRVRLAQGEVDASRLTSRQIDDLALRDAEVIVNIAVHQWNEECDRKARR